MEGSDSITRDILIPLDTALGAYTFRTDVVDSASIAVPNNNPMVSLTVSPTEITDGVSVRLDAITSDNDRMGERGSFIHSK